MLQAYRWLQLSSSSSPPPPIAAAESSLAPETRIDSPADEVAGELPQPAADHPHHDGDGRAGEDGQDGQEGGQLAASRRRQLANRLSKLAKLGGKHSRQVLDSLRSALELDPKWPEFTRYRALRLIRPTTQLSGRFTCSVSSLEGDDLRSKQLVVYGKLL